MYASRDPAVPLRNAADRMVRSFGLDAEVHLMFDEGLPNHRKAEPDTYNGHV